ncbi:MAG: FG-GAP repeat domain-containing protein [Planctomycetota bacterium]
MHTTPRTNRLVILIANLAFVASTFVISTLANRSPSLLAADVALREQELPTKLTVGYAVRLLDMNADKRLDICIVDSDRILWLENPNWNEHILVGPGQTKKDNVCFAPYDIDGDGLPEFAVGADWRPFDTATGGTIQWIGRGEKPQDSWRVYPIGEEPTVHRMQFADLDADGRAELIVSPLMGRGTTKPNWAEAPVRLLAYTIPKDPRREPWVPKVLNEDVHVTHNLIPADVDGDGKLDLLLVSFEGVHWLRRTPSGSWQRTRIGTGNQATSPNRGASEIKYGKLGKTDYIATIEPWHGSQVVVYTRPTTAAPAIDPSAKPNEWLWQRHLLDEKLAWGHGVFCANLDDDADEELIIGVRDDLDPQNRRGVRIYDPTDAAAGKWSRQVIDPGSVAVEDLAAGDLNGDGRVDIVAVGRQTHNVKIYWNSK